MPSVAPGFRHRGDTDAIRRLQARDCQWARPTAHPQTGGLSGAEDTGWAHLLQQPRLLPQPGLQFSHHLLESAPLLLRVPLLLPQAVLEHWGEAAVGS